MPTRSPSPPLDPPATPPAMPTPEPNGFVRTLNNMGYMTSTLDPISAAFVAFAPVAPGMVLDVGAAYGVATLAALAAGARVVANDLDERHLHILATRTPASARERLTLCPGAFPETLDFPPAQLGGVLLARVLHFFPGERIRKGLQRLHTWLAPGGKVFVVAETPYLGNFRDFIPTYEARRQAGDPWPGFIADVMAVAPERGRFLPPQVHWLDPTVLTREFCAAGFLVEQADFLARPDFPADLQLDGRESVGIIARKE